MARADGGWTADEWATAEREADWILQMARNRAQSRQSAADSDDEDDDTEQQQNPLAAARAAAAAQKAASPQRLRRL